MTIRHRIVPTWQTATFYVVLLILLQMLASLVERPIFLLLSQSMFTLISLIRLVVEFATTWLCSFLAIKIVRHNFQLSSRQQFKIWATSVFLILNLLLLFANLSSFGPLVMGLTRFGPTVLLTVGGLLIAVTCAYFWWITDLVLRDQPDWAVGWVMQCWRWLDGVTKGSRKPNQTQA